MNVLPRNDMSADAFLANNRSLHSGAGRRGGGEFAIDSAFERVPPVHRKRGAGVHKPGGSDFVLKVVLYKTIDGEVALGMVPVF